MYNSSGATIRADLNILVEEAAAADNLFIGHLVMPPMPVDAKAGTYPKLEIAGGALLDNIATERSRGGSYGQVSRKWGSDSYDCQDRGLEEPIDDVDKKDLGRFFNLEKVTSRLCLRNVKLQHELRVAAQIVNTTNFGAATNSAVAYTVANEATINFQRDIIDAIARVNSKGAVANTIVMSEDVLFRLQTAPKLVTFIRGTLGGEIDRPVNDMNIAAAFRANGIKNCFIGRSRYNSGKKGAAFSAASCWPNTHVWVGQVNPNATMPEEGGAGFTLYWNAEGGLWVTETYRNETIRSNVIRVRQNTVEKVTDPTAGTLIATQYA